MPVPFTSADPKPSIAAMRSLAAVLAGTGLITGCAAPPSAGVAAPVGLANPATLACQRAGGSVVNQRMADGAERGLCRFDSGQVCDQWAFFRGECRPTAVDRRSGS